MLYVQHRLLVSLQLLVHSSISIIFSFSSDISISFSEIDFVIAPGLAFDVFGNRVGYGGGFYDKFFKKTAEDVIRVALSYDFQLLDSVPHSDLDEPVHFLITDVATLRCRDAQGIEV